MQPYQKIAKILRTPENVIYNLQTELEGLTNKKDVLRDLVKINEEKIKDRLQKMNLSSNILAKDVFNGLQKKVSRCNDIFDKKFTLEQLIEAAQDISGKPKGFFISDKKMRDLFFKNPPQNILNILGYKNVEEMFQKEDITELVCALRFAEDSLWLNNVFFRPYNHLQKEDFEEREIKIVILPKKWEKVGRKFVGHKLHNISHLKEFGIIFIIPTENINKFEVFTLLLHYLFEIQFYSKLFKRYQNFPNFGENIISALKGEIIGYPLRYHGTGKYWQIIQRYLAKDDPNDPRLFEPHVNPEALHWENAERLIFDFAKKNKNICDEIIFFEELDFVGDYFPENNGEVLISFDLIDNVISFSKGTSVFEKYLYHQQEALWNEIFKSYVGDGEKLEEILIDNMDKGYIYLPDVFKKEDIK
ncbi:MAG: hypothetical protein PHO31_03075 [Candidatus Pacebacteria bacterium]|nr:hypothetical protein [Candidatus Paceibacterota bacterium]